ncbi:hypothetical protein GXW82_13660 [Streptacidiphilus sp. 4-A2]|nr:hypothetical protein [Streptacidiphilus sp. 4-A2]
MAGEHPATIGLLMPMTSSDGSVQAEILHAVQGAYVAQYRADNLDDNTVPKIRLVLANPGSDSSGWLTVDRQLDAMTGAPDYLRVVAGIEDSTQNTQAEVHWLTHLPDPIPVVGGTITADTIANTANSQPFPGLARVSVTNGSEAAALARFAKVNSSQAMVVEDTRTDDDYITTLKEAISKQLGAGMAQPVQFTSPEDISQDGDTENQFDQKVLNICMAEPRFIYFAGRHVQLRQFLNALGQGCPERKFIVLTGDDASHLASDKLLNPRTSAGSPWSTRPWRSPMPGPRPRCRPPVDRPPTTRRSSTRSARQASHSAGRTSPTARRSSLTMPCGQPYRRWITLTSAASSCRRRWPRSARSGRTCTRNCGSTAPAAGSAWTTVATHGTRQYP